MPRVLDPANESHVEQSHVRPVLFAHLNFDVDPVYAHNSLGTITWGGQDWHGLGGLAEVSQVEEGLELSPYALRMTLSGINEDVSGPALGVNYFGRDAKLYLGWIDDNDELEADPDEVWSGFMDTMDIITGSPNDDSITVICESEFALFDKANGAMFTDESQRRLFPGDLFLEYMHQVIDANPIWGGVPMGRHGGPGRAQINPIAGPPGSPGIGGGGIPIGEIGGGGVTLPPVTSPGI